MSSYEQYEQEEQRLRAKLKPLLTEDFLSTLIESARTYGWTGDYIEVMAFVGWCHEIANKPHPTKLEPFNTP